MPAGPACCASHRAPRSHTPSPACGAYPGDVGAPPKPTVPCAAMRPCPALVAPTNRGRLGGVSWPPGCATGQQSGPPVFRRGLGYRRTSRSKWSVPLPRGRWEGANGSVAPARRESGVMSGQAKARRVSSSVVVQNAQAWSTSPVDRAARHPFERVEKALQEEEPFMLLTRGRRHKFGAGELNHPL